MAKKAEPKKAGTKQGAAKSEIEVKIGSPGGGKILPYKLFEGATVKEALEEAIKKGNLQVNLTDKSLDVRVNGAKISSLEAVLADNDQVFLFAKIAGN